MKPNTLDEPDPPARLALFSAEPFFSNNLFENSFMSETIFLFFSQRYELA
jgi:hypothetical protein